MPHLVKLSKCTFSECNKTARYILLGDLNNLRKVYCEEHAEPALALAIEKIERYHEMKAP